MKQIHHHAITRLQVIFLVAACLAISLGCNFVTRLLPGAQQQPEITLSATAVDLATSTLTPTATPTELPVPTPTPTEINYSRFEVNDCNYGKIDNPMACGYLIAPEDHNNPQNGRTVKLPVVILYSRTENSQPDPLVYLSGGPGQNGVIPDEWLSFPFLDNRDLVLFDQRGTGNAQPSLNCPEYDKNKPTQEKVVAKQCHDRLVKEGIDLVLFNSIQSATDLHELRLSLGYSSWNILGISYGTRLALTAMRYHPQGIRSVILDSVYPPQVNSLEEEITNGARAFQVLFDECAADTNCTAHYPALAETLYKVVDKLNDNPGVYKGEVFYGDDVVNIIFDAFYDYTLIKYIPFVVYEAKRGNFKPLQLLEDGSIVDEYHRLQQEQANITDSEGVFYSVQCYEEVPFNNEQKAESQKSDLAPQIDNALLGSVEVMFDVCAFWEVDKAPPEENTPVQSAIPTLLLSGQYDPITPPQWAKLAASSLSNSTYIEFPGIGHDTIDSNPCSVDITAAFLNDPARKPDTSCISSVSGPGFYTP